MPPHALCLASPQVLAVGPRDMRMYYTCWEPRLQRYVVAMAVSPDGFKWTKKGVVFDPAAAAAGGQAGAHDALGAASISVVRDVDNRQYLMLYEAVAADNRRSVGMAVSKDGTSWKRYGRPVLLPAGAEAEAAGGVSWDEGDVGSPCAVSMSAGKWRLYYCGRKERGPGKWGTGLETGASEWGEKQTSESSEMKQEHLSGVKSRRVKGPRCMRRMCARGMGLTPLSGWRCRPVTSCSLVLRSP